MNYPPGKIILLDEFEDNPEKWIGDYFRVVGKLIYHNMSKNLAVIEQNVKYTTDKGKQHEGQPHDNVRIRKCFLIVDTKLVEDEPYIEEMITADIQRTRFPLLEARIFRTVDFMDMDFYQYVVNIRNKYEQE